MLHISITRFGVVRGTSRELVEAAAQLLSEPIEDAWMWDLSDPTDEIAA